MKIIRKRTIKPTVERIIEIARDMIPEALDEAYKFVTGNVMPTTTEGAIMTHMADIINKMNEEEQKSVLKKFKEMLRG